MKISTGVGLSILLASTAEACTRVLVKEVWQSETKRTRDLTLWDDEMSEGVQLKWGGALNDGTSREQWSGQGYWAGIYQNNDGGQVQYPNKRSKWSRKSRGSWGWKGG